MMGLCFGRAKTKQKKKQNKKKSNKGIDWGY
jgi:hypothetical protein